VSSVEIERPAPVPNVQDAARGIAASLEGVLLARAATTLYEAGGAQMLGAGTQAALRVAAEGAGVNVMGAGAALFLREGAKQVARNAGRQVAVSAGKQILKGATRAAGLGLAIDGAFATYEAVRAVRAGDMTKPMAFQHVGKEAVSGALATAAGTLACVGLIALTGPISIPAAVVCGAGASLGAKTVLRKWIDRRLARRAKPEEE
jgi:hypothetical protein